MLATRGARWIAGAVLVCLMLVAAFWLLLISPRMAQATEIRDQASAAASRNDMLELQIAQLRAQFAELPQRRAELAAIEQQMPARAAVPELVRSLYDAAKSTGVLLTDVTPGSASALVVEPVAPQAAPAEPAGDTEAAADQAATSATQAAAGPTIVAIPMSVTVEGDYFEVVAFVKKLQAEIDRMFLINSLKVSTSDTKESAGTITLQIGGRVFALPDGPGAEATAPAADAPSTTGEVATS